MITFNVYYNNHHISNTTYTKFLGLITDDTLSWKYQIDQIMSKLNLACFANKIN